MTSRHAGEGKTTTAVNVAITLSQTGSRVVILDCDMRNPRIHKAIGLENNGGMSTYLSGNSELIPLIQKTDVENLFAISAGRIPPNPNCSVRYRMKRGWRTSRIRHIVIDSPPFLPVTDARIIRTLVDGSCSY